MLSERQQEERNVRKKTILDGALKVFKTHGIEKTTMDEIASESGFGKATLYYYFTSKDEVFIAIMEDGWKHLWEGIESKIVEELGPRKKFMGIIRKMASIVKSDKIDEINKLVKCVKWMNFVILVAGNWALLGPHWVALLPRWGGLRPPKLPEFRRRAPHRSPRTPPFHWGALRFPRTSLWGGSPPLMGRRAPRQTPF